MEMASLQNFPTVSFKTGVTMEERRFTWTIENFHVVLLHDSLVDAQEIEFSAGASIGLESKWIVNLSSNLVDGKKWAGIYFNIKERPALESEFLFANCAFKVTDRNGRTKFNRTTTIKDMYSAPSEDCAGWGYPAFTKMDVNLEDPVDETMTIHITFRLYSPSVITQSVEAAVAEFEKKSPPKELKHLGLLHKPGSLADIKIQSSDKKWFTAKKEILSARSPVFETMLKTNMTEGKDGVIKISDLSSKALGVLLHYISFGGLHKDWRESDVLVELTNAAAKYQLPDLLHFLDGVIGRVCNVENVGALLTLANRLSLKQAEADLLSFVRINGTGSAEALFGILNTMSTPRDVFHKDAGANTDGMNFSGGEVADCHASNSGNSDSYMIITAFGQKIVRTKKDGEREDPPARKKRMRMHVMSIVK